MDRAETIDAILRLVAMGKSLRSACAERDVDHSTFLFWVREDRDLAKQYARAMEARADAVFDELFDIADEGSDDVQRDKLRVDTRKWAIARMNPRKYGDRLGLDHAGELTVVIGSKDAGVL